MTSINLVFLAHLVLSGYFPVDPSETPASYPEKESTAITYYVDPSGSDSNSGTSIASPWKTLSKVSSTTFTSGDKILFKSGGVWDETLTLNGSGSINQPIVVDKYAGEIKPRINGGGTTNASNAILLNQGSYWEISNLEVTNTVPESLKYSVTGIRIMGASAGEPAVNSIKIRNCYVHDVNSAKNGEANYQKMSGGIIFQGKFNGVLVESCHIANCAVEGLRTGAVGTKSDWSKNVVFNNNLIQNIYGDGIVLSGVTDGSKAIHNTVYNACMNTGRENYAAIWTISSYKTLIAYNEVYGLKGGVNDGTAFDADGFSDASETDGDIFEYNYTHDNNSGFMLLMHRAKNIIVRYNVSVNDIGEAGSYTKKLFIIENSGNTNRQIYNNVFYITSPVNNLFRVVNGSGKPVANFSNNIFYVTSHMDNFANVPLDSNMQFHHNIFYHPNDRFSAVNWGSSLNRNTILDHPQFLDPTGGNGISAAHGFRLQPGSPGVGAGVVIPDNGGRDFPGTVLPVGPPSIGAFQNHAGSTNRK